MFFTHNVHVNVVHFLLLALRLTLSFTGSLLLLRFLASSLCRASCILVMTTGQLSCRTRQRTIWQGSRQCLGTFLRRLPDRRSFEAWPISTSRCHCRDPLSYKNLFLVWCVVNTHVEGKCWFSFKLMAVKLRRYTTCDSGKIGICIELLLRRRQGVETLAVLPIIPVLLVVGFFSLADRFANRIFAAHIDLRLAATIFVWIC